MLLSRRNFTRRRRTRLRLMSKDPTTLILRASCLQDRPIWRLRVRRGLIPLVGHHGGRTVQVVKTTTMMTTLDVGGSHARTRTLSGRGESGKSSLLALLNGSFISFSLQFYSLNMSR